MNEPRIGPRQLRARILTLAVVAAICAAAWLAFVWLDGILRVSEVYIVAGQTGVRWAVLCFITATATVATLVSAGLLISLILTVLRWPVLRAVIGVLMVLAWVAGALYLAVCCYFGLLAVGIEGTQTFVTAANGTTLMVTQDGFDGDMVDFYEPGPGWSWIRRHEMGTVDPRSGPCTLTTTDSTLTITCGPHRQTIPRN